jgi:glycosyltransferase involved in cell wall biosynthesis
MKEVDTGPASGSLRVTLVGVYPPPYGGISIHIQRLLAACLENGFRCVVYKTVRQTSKVANVYPLSHIRNLLRFLVSAHDIVHVHTSGANWMVPVVFFCLAKIKSIKYILSYHSLRETRREFGTVGRLMMKMVLRSASQCIASNTDIKEKLTTMGAPPEKVSVIPAFLPPVIKEEEIAEVPRETRDFIAGHEPVIAANAYSIVKYRGQDLYGIDMCIDMCAALKVDYPRLGVVFCLPHVGDMATFEELKRRVSEKGIAANFLFQTKPCQFYPVLMKSQIFVRPTNTDGDAVSLREALYLKVPSVASDAVPRPTGTIIFTSRNLDEFVGRIKDVWKNYSDYKTQLESLSVPHAFGDIKKIYNIIMNDKSGK